MVKRTVAVVESSVDLVFVEIRRTRGIGRCDRVGRIKNVDLLVVSGF